MMTVSLKRRFLGSLCGVVALVVGSGLVTRASGQPASPGDVPRSVLAPSDGRIVARLHAINQEEISAGKMAETNGYAQAVRDFGATLVSDHQAADQTLLAYAKKAGIDPNAMPQDIASKMEAEHAKVEHLRPLTGQRFDQEFAQTMRDGHAQVIALVQTTVPQVSSPELRALLNGLLPTLRAHYETAARLASSPAAAASSPQTPKATSTGSGQPPSTVP